MAPVLELSSQTFRRYALRHGYEFVVGDGYSAGRPPAWGKVLLIQKLLADYDEVLWIDADAIILDDSCDLAREVPSSAFQAIPRPPHPRIRGRRLLNTGVWFLRGEEARSFISRVWEQEHRTHHKWWEMMAVLDLLGFDESGDQTRLSPWRDGTAWLDDQWNIIEEVSGLKKGRIRHYAGRPNDYRVARMMIDVKLLNHKAGARLEDIAWRLSPTHIETERIKRRLSSRSKNLGRKVLNFVSPERREHRRRWDKLEHDLRETGRVRYGPFAGLNYGSESSWGTQIPLLLGSYESELHPIVVELCDVPYDCVIDVGCSEGYYAVGFARAIEGAEVFAFDIDPRARELCRQMAERNGVASRVHVDRVCTPEDLSRLVATRTLIIVDCEGCELSLLDPSLVPTLRHADLVVELHDFLDPTISTTICERFASTHEIVLIRAVGPQVECYPILNDLPMYMRRRALDERRPLKPHPMQWAYMRALDGGVA